MNEEKRFIIRIHSPVHIGCDEVYEPTGFVIDETAAVLTAFNPLDFIRTLGKQDLERLKTICRKGTLESILELYKFMRGKSGSGQRIPICRGLIDQYRQTMSMPLGDRRRIQQELNRFTIARTAFHPVTQAPYLPGSAIKGTLRTAYLNRQQFLKKTPKARNAGELERNLLDGGSFQTDPFRLLKVSDFQPLGPCATRIVFAVNEKKTRSRFDARGPYQILEVIEAGAIFVGAIKVLPPPSREAIRTPLTEESLFESSRDFYSIEKNREDEELRDIDIKPVPSWERQATPLRLGRHSGAECLTIAGQRRIRIMQGGGRPAKFSDEGATTFWLAADSASGYERNRLTPFGWATLEAVTGELPEIQQTAPTITETSEIETRILTSPLGGVAAPDTAVKAVEAPAKETWPDVRLTWNPGNAEITAFDKDNRRAFGTGKELVPAPMQKKLFRDKSIRGAVIVERIGNRYKILEIA